MLKQSRFLVIILSAGLQASAWAQHDPARNAGRQLAKGEYKAATKELDKKAKNSEIDQAERHVVRSLAASLRGDGKSALAEAKLAVKNGAQPGHFVAGTKHGFASLSNTDGYREWISQFDIQLVHGPMIGDVSSDSAKIWIRTSQPTQLTITVNAKGADRLAAHIVEVNTSSDTENTGVAIVSGLRPQTNYHVTVNFEGKEIAKGAFQTTVPTGKPGKFTMVLGGGAGFTPKYERMWTTIQRNKPDALFLLGDNVYIDDPTHSLTNHFVYHRRQSQPEWRSLVSKTPTYSIYDDHDFGLNDCVPGPFIEKPEWKRKVWEIFRNNWVNPAYGGGDEQPGCWYQKYIGDVHFVCLDCRYYRDRAGRTMLGPVQKQWLLDTLKKSKGTFKVLASTVPLECRSQTGQS